MKRIVPAFFVLVAATLIVVFLTRRTGESAASESTAAVVSESSSESVLRAETDSGASVESAAPVSFMPLRNGETLLNSMGIDLDDDRFDDEILVVRKSNKPNLYLVIGLYNQATSLYDRMAEIETPVTQLKSFSYNGIDVTGDHRTALVYQGMTDSGESVMQIYFCRRPGGNFVLTKIGDFRSDGTIFIQQSNRTDTYELSQSSDSSFPVWVYSSDTREGAGNLSQVQTEYDWDPGAGRYVQTRQIYVTGKNLAAKELARIQDGTVKTFAGYLNGLWYKTENSPNEVRYIFFDYENSEVNFLVNDSQEVYNWLDSTLYRNGIYLSTVNSSIDNLRRRFDISLTDIDEMRVHVYDDVRMRIGSDTLWDGQYRKMNVKKDFNAEEDTDALSKDFTSRLEESEAWYVTDGSSFVFRDGFYSVNSDTNNENGVYFITQIGNCCVIQFNPQSALRYLLDSYIIKYSQKEVPAGNRNKKLQYVDDRDVIILQPAAIMSSSCYEITGRVITLTATE